MSRVWIFCAALAVSGCGDTTPTTPTLANPDIAAFVTAMNQYRSSVGCPVLAWNANVAAVAQAHSQDMVVRDFFAHTNPDGQSPFDRMAAAGITFSGAAENIAYGYASGDAVLAGWLGSPGHKTNIENCGLTEHGVGLSGTHWTHVFIRP